MTDLCNGKELIYDQACLIFNNARTDSLHISSQSTECYQCPLLPLLTLEPVKSQAIVVPSTHGKIFEVFLNDNHTCREVFHFSQHGFYQWNMTDLKLCDKLLVIKDPHNLYLPLWVAVGILTALVVSWFSALRFSQRLRTFLGYTPYRNELERDFGSPSSTPDSTSLAPNSSRRVSRHSPNRIKALDTFRGITICLMIFVNAGGGKYRIFSHSAWNGLNLADVIFPWFAWIMGIGIILSLRYHIRENMQTKQLFLNILRRSILLILFGLILNSLNTNDLNKVRIPGVLQRLGVSYFVVVSIELLLMKPHISGQNLLSSFSDITSRCAQWLFLLIFSAFHIGFSLDSTVPGCPKGYIGPGGLHMNGSAFNCTGGLAGYIDRNLFGKHMFMIPTSADVYHSVLPFDPEGLLGTLTTIVTVGFGTQAGQILITYRSCKSRVVRLFFWGLITGLSGGILCGWKKEGGFIPINKNLWSASFVLTTASLAFISLAILYLIVDYKGLWNGYPFVQAGKNPLLLYMLSVVFKNSLPWSWIPFDKSTHTEYLYMNLWGTLLWIIFSLYLDYNKLYLVL